MVVGSTCMMSMQKYIKPGVYWVWIRLRIKDEAQDLANMDIAKEYTRYKRKIYVVPKERIVP